MKDQDLTLEIVKDFLEGGISRADAINKLEISESEFDIEVENQKLIIEGLRLRRLSSISKHIKTNNKEYTSNEEMKKTLKVLAFVFLFSIAASLIYLGYQSYYVDKSAKSLNNDSKKVEPQSQFLEDIRDTEVRNLNSPIKSGESKASSTSELKSLVQQKDTVASELSIIPKTNYGLTRDDSNKPEPLENVLVEKTQVSVCNSKDLKYSVSFKNSCIGEINGEINIEEVQGGQLPYLFSIDNGVNCSKGSDFSGLGKGVYHVSVIDHLGCKSAQIETLQIIETNCEGQGKKEYIFNPSHNELVIQNTFQLSGVIEIYSYSGSEVFRKQFLNFESITWNGYGSNNVLVQPGNYIFKISYSDNSMENGSITVTY